MSSGKHRVLIVKPQDSLISPIFKIYTQVDIIPNRIGTPSTTSHTHTKLIIYGKMHLNTMVQFNSVQFSRLPKDCSMPGFPVHHQILEFTQTHVRWVGNAIQPSHPLSSPSPPAFNLSQHQGLFHWVSSLHQVAKVLEFQLQHQSFQWIFRTDFLKDGLVGSPCSPRDSQESSPASQFKSINSSALSFFL